MYTYAVKIFVSFRSVNHASQDRWVFSDTIRLTSVTNHLCTCIHNLSLWTKCSMDLYIHVYFYMHTPICECVYTVCVYVCQHLPISTYKCELLLLTWENCSPTSTSNPHSLFHPLPPSLSPSLTPSLSHSLTHYSLQHENPFASERIRKPNNLPQDRSSYSDNTFTVAKSSAGFLTYQEVVEILNTRESDEKESWTAQVVSEKYNIDPVEAQNLLKYFSTYKQLSSNASPTQELR